MAVFTLETDYPCETSYPFDNSRQIGNTSQSENGIVLILNDRKQSVRLCPSVYPSISMDSLKMDYPFQRACVQPPPPLSKIEKGVSVGEGATVHRLVLDG